MCTGVTSVLDVIYLFLSSMHFMIIVFSYIVFYYRAPLKISIQLLSGSDPLLKK